MSTKTKKNVVDAAFKQVTKSGKYDVYNIDKNDPDNGNKLGIVGSIYLPAGSDITEVTVRCIPADADDDE